MGGGDGGDGGRRGGEREGWLVGSVTSFVIIIAKTINVITIINIIILG